MALFIIQMNDYADLTGSFVVADKKAVYCLLFTSILSIDEQNSSINLRLMFIYATSSSLNFTGCCSRQGVFKGRALVRSLISKQEFN